METTYSFNTAIIETIAMLLVFVVLPAYWLIKQQSLELLKGAVITLITISAVIGITTFLIGITLNSFVALVAAPLMAIFVYYLLLFGFIKLLGQRIINQRLLLFLAIALLLFPIAWVIIDIDSFSEILFGYLVGPIDMR